MELMDSYNPTVQALQRENKKLRAENKALAVERDLNVRQADAYKEENERLKAELAEAKKDAERYREWKYRFREGECELFNALADCATDEEHDAAIDAALAACDEAMKGK